ncbi:MAG: hypothetical protein WC523_02465 [Patescibacteria group bacterium]|jgi:hypothetical protein
MKKFNRFLLATGVAIVLATLIGSLTVRFCYWDFDLVFIVIFLSLLVFFALAGLFFLFIGPYVDRSVNFFKLFFSIAELGLVTAFVMLFYFNEAHQRESVFGISSLILIAILLLPFFTLFIKDDLVLSGNRLNDKPLVKKARIYLKTLTQIILTLAAALAIVNWLLPE